MVTPPQMTGSAATDGGAIMASHDGGLLAAQHDGGALASHDGGGMMSSSNGQSKPRSVIGITGGEFFGVLGFASMFTGVGALISVAAGAAALTTVTALTVGIGLALGLGSLFISSALKEKVKNQEAAMETKGREPTQVIINNIAVQPDVSVEAEANFFTKMLGAERTQPPREPHR